MKTTVLAVASLTLFCGCHNSDKRSNNDPSQLKYAEAENEQGKHPYIELDENQKAIFVSKVQSVAIGDSRRQVELVLGIPWSDQVRQEKNFSRAFMGRLVVYYVRKQAQNIDNERLDLWVEFWFDKNDCLNKIYAQNIGDIKNIP